MSENNVSTKATRGEELIVPTVPVDQVTQLVEENAIFMQPSELNAIVENIKEVKPPIKSAEFDSTVIDVEQALLDEATAAGLGAGGENGGNSFVRLLRILEETNPLSYEFPQTTTDELLPFNGVAGNEEVVIVEEPPVDPPPPPDPVAPVISVWNDSNNNGTFESQFDNRPEIYSSISQVDPNGTGTDKIFIGDLLKEQQPITTEQLESNPPANTVLEHTSDITFTFLSEGAGYMNAVGWYDLNNPTIGHVVWENASAKNSGGTLKNGDQITFDDVPAGTQIGFFMIQESYTYEGHIPDTVYFKDGHAYKNDDFTGLIDYDDKGRTFDPLNVWFSNSPNTDELQHVITGISETDAPNVLYVGFEDLTGGGDNDYNDVVFKVDLGEGNNVYRPPVEFDVGVQINDADSTMLSKAVLTFELLDPEDDITYTSVAGLTVERTGDEFTITGNASILDYNDLLDSFHLVVGGIEQSTTPTVEHREATLQVWDETGMASNVDTAVFDLLIPPELPKPPIGGDAC